MRRGSNPYNDRSDAKTTMNKIRVYQFRQDGSEGLMVGPRWATPEAIARMPGCSAVEASERWVDRELVSDDGFLFHTPWQAGNVEMQQLADR
jgi:hypothetical protein